MTDRIYPQFATHNAHTMAAVVHMAEDPSRFEFQRLHGMSEALHDTVREAHGVRSRIYAPVGAHRDLLAYLVRRTWLLNNGRRLLPPSRDCSSDITTRLSGCYRTSANRWRSRR